MRDMGKDGTATGGTEQLSSGQSGLVAFFENVPLLSALFSFSLAQLAKFLLHYANHGRWDVTRLWGSGGMPSSHTAFVTGLAMSGETAPHAHGR